MELLKQINMKESIKSLLITLTGGISTISVLIGLVLNFIIPPLGLLLTFGGVAGIIIATGLEYEEDKKKMKKYKHNKII